MSTRRETLDKRCSRCKIHLSLCFCNSFQKFPNLTPVSILMHFKELPLTSNTSSLVLENLSQCDIYLRGHPEKERNREIKLQEGKENVILFPDEKAIDIREMQGEKLHLIVPDGSWRQAKKFQRRDENLRSLPSVKIVANHQSQYRLRTQIHEYGLCTLEAIAYALGELEGEEVKNHLLHRLNIMNERVLISRAGGIKNLIN